MTATTLDTRSWLVWSLGCMLPILVSRNPWIAVEIGLIVMTVRLVAARSNSAVRTGWLIRVAAVMALVGAAFNLLTVRTGDIVLLELPGGWPIVGGVLTLNALIFGLVSGLTLFVLVLIGVTTASLIRWIDLFHILPRRLAPIAATGSVAWAFLPQTAIAWQNIRETMAMRGMRFHSLRDYLPIVVPLLASGLDRSLTMAEALEARGFGAPLASGTSARRASQTRWLAVLMVAGLGAAMLAAYLLATGATIGGAVALFTAIALLTTYGRFAPSSSAAVSQYRTLRLAVADRLTMLGATITLVTTLTWLWWRPETLTLTFYPSLAWPDPVPLLLLGLSPLMLPAFLLHRNPNEAP